MRFSQETLLHAGALTLPLRGAATVSLERWKEAYAESVGTAGHEIDHSSRQATSRAATKSYADEVNRIVNTAGQHDYTAPLKAFLDVQRDNEARSHLEHFNSVSRSLGDKPSERDIYDANRSRMAMFFNVQEGPEYAKLSRVRSRGSRPRHGQG